MHLHARKRFDTPAPRKPLCECRRRHGMDSKGEKQLFVSRRTSDLLSPSKNTMACIQWLGASNVNNLVVKPQTRGSRYSCDGKSLPRLTPRVQSCTEIPPAQVMQTTPFPAGHSPGASPHEGQAADGAQGGKRPSRDSALAAGRGSAGPVLNVGSCSAGGPHPFALRSADPSAPSARAPATDTTSAARPPQAAPMAPATQQGSAARAAHATSTARAAHSRVSAPATQTPASVCRPRTADAQRPTRSDRNRSRSPLKGKMLHCPPAVRAVAAAARPAPGLRPSVPTAQQVCLRSTPKPPPRAAACLHSPAPHRLSSAPASPSGPPLAHSTAADATPPHSSERIGAPGAGDGPGGGPPAVGVPVCDVPASQSGHTGRDVMIGGEHTAWAHDVPVTTTTVYNCGPMSGALYSGAGHADPPRQPPLGGRSVEPHAQPGEAGERGRLHADHPASRDHRTVRQAGRDVVHGVARREGCADACADLAAKDRLDRPGLAAQPRLGAGGSAPSAGHADCAVPCRSDAPVSAGGQGRRIALRFPPHFGRTGLGARAVLAEGMAEVRDEARTEAGSEAEAEVEGDAAAPHRPCICTPPPVLVRRPRGGREREGTDGSRGGGAIPAARPPGACPEWEPAPVGRGMGPGLDMERGVGPGPDPTFRVHDVPVTTTTFFRCDWRGSALFREPSPPRRPPVVTAGSPASKQVGDGKALLPSHLDGSNGRVVGHGAPPHGAQHRERGERAAQTAVQSPWVSADHTGPSVHYIAEHSAPHVVQCSVECDEEYDVALRARRRDRAEGSGDFGAEVAAHGLHDGMPLTAQPCLAAAGSPNPTTPALHCGPRASGVEPEHCRAASSAVEAQVVPEPEPPCDAEADPTAEAECAPDPVGAHATLWAQNAPVSTTTFYHCDEVLLCPPGDARRLLRRVTQGLAALVHEEAPLPGPRGQHEGRQAAPPQEGATGSTQHGAPPSLGGEGATHRPRRDAPHVVPHGRGRGAQRPGGHSAAHRAGLCAAHRAERGVEATVLPAAHDADSTHAFRGGRAEVKVRAGIVVDAAVEAEAEAEAGADAEDGAKTGVEEERAWHAEAGADRDAHAEAKVVAEAETEAMADLDAEAEAEAEMHDEVEAAAVVADGDAWAEAEAVQAMADGQARAKAMVVAKANTQGLAAGAAECEAEMEADVEGRADGRMEREPACTPRPTPASPGLHRSSSRASAVEQEHHSAVMSLCSASEPQAAGPESDAQADAKAEAEALAQTVTDPKAHADADLQDEARGVAVATAQAAVDGKAEAEAEAEDEAAAKREVEAEDEVQEAGKSLAEAKTGAEHNAKEEEMEDECAAQAEETAEEDEVEEEAAEDERASEEAEMEEKEEEAGEETDTEDEGEDLAEADGEAEEAGVEAEDVAGAGAAPHDAAVTERVAEALQNGRVLPVSVPLVVGVMLNYGAQP